ncbi:hypothetical protein MRX96_055994 [Rhipicephalus microplus]
MLRLARKRRWQLIEEKRLQQEIELQTYLNQLILLDKKKRVQEMKIMGTRQGDIERVEAALDKYISELNNIFAKVDERRRKREVPDYLCGKISFEIMREPVITPSGITYDRRDIEEHLQASSSFQLPLSIDSSWLFTRHF